MILLTSTSDIIRVTPSAATAVHVQASWINNAAGTITPGRTNSILSAASVATVVAAPTGTDQRNVKHLSCVAVGGANTLTIEHYDGTNAVQIYKAALATGESVVFNDGAGFQTFDATGALKEASVNNPGRLIKTTTYLTGSGNHTTDAKTSKIRVRLVGGGGGGGGCSSVAAAAAAAGGGGSGGWAEKTWDVSPATAFAYAVGAAGTGASGAAGNNGGNTTFTGPAAVVVTAYGGTGGYLATAATTLTAGRGGAGGVVSTNGDINGGGAPGVGGYILIVTGSIGGSGAGGSSPFGGGGPGIIAAGAGVAATGYGAGGGGALTAISAARAGGNGTIGMIIVDEYA